MLFPGPFVLAQVTKDQLSLHPAVVCHYQRFAEFKAIGQVHDEIFDAVVLAGEAGQAIIGRLPADFSKASKADNLEVAQ